MRNGLACYAGIHRLKRWQPSYLGLHQSIGEDLLSVLDTLFAVLNTPNKVPRHLVCSSSSSSTNSNLDLEKMCLGLRFSWYSQGPSKRSLCLISGTQAPVEVQQHDRHGGRC